jgi:transcriptional regulator with XRE-family HTH domain
MTTERLGPGVPINGAAVRRIRLLRCHLSVIGLARELQISRDYVHKIESGARPSVSPEMFRRLKRALQAETAELLAEHEMAAS